jgi:hypothetical protein
MTAVWASHHEALCSAGVVAPHVHTHMVAPHRWGVLDGGNPLGSAVDASRRPSMGRPLPHSFNQGKPPALPRDSQSLTVPGLCSSWSSQFWF